MITTAIPSLARLLFTESANLQDIEEAAKTASDAVSMDYALITGRPDGQYMFVLVDTRNARETLSKIVPGMGLFEWFNEVNDAIKAVMFLEDNEDGKTISVRNSAAVSGFGPLIYELAMSGLAPKYLTTDTKVTLGAMNLWSKFYERQDVTKVPLEKLYRQPCEEVVKGLLRSAANHIVRHMPDRLQALSLIEQRITDCRNHVRPQPVDEFLSELSQQIDLKLLPMLFGYTMQHGSPGTVRVLANEGSILTSELMREFGIDSRKDFALEFGSAASDFFNRMYK